MATNMTFVDFVTPIPSDWLNNVNTFVNTPVPTFNVFNVKAAPYNATGNGTTDDTAALLSAISAAGVSGGIVSFPEGTYLISQSLSIPSNVYLRGVSPTGSVIKAVANGTGFSGNPNAMILLNASNSGVQDLGIDGNINNNTTLAFGGISNHTSVSNLLISNVAINNTIYVGILFQPSTGFTSNFRIDKVSMNNIGWDGISLYSCTQFSVTNCNLVSLGGNGIRTDYSGINSNSCSHGRILHNYVTKATPPSHVVTPQVESGFMIVNGAGDSYIVVGYNDLYDNRNAAQDGLGLGQDGMHVNEGLVWIGNIITYAGLYGLDMSSNHIAVGNYIRYSAQQGIKFGTDAGGNLVNSTCAHNIIDSCNLAGIGTTEGIWVDATLTVPIPTALYENIKIVGNRVVDFNGTPHTIYGLGIGFRNNLTYQNCEFSDNDWSQLTGNAQGNAFHTTGPGANFAGWTWKGNKHPVLMPAITGATPQIMGLDACFISQSGATNVTNLLGGYNGKEITIQHQDSNSTYVTPVFQKTAGGNTNALAASVYRFFQYGGTWLLQQFY